MRIACVVPPLHLPVNELGHGYHPPLGLLTVAGPLVDSGATVRLLDADAGHVSPGRVVQWLKDFGAQVVFIGHSGSMAANPAALQLARAIKAAQPALVTVYGGVYPTYAAEELMGAEPALDFIVRGEGEITACELISALQEGQTDFGSVDGLVWRSGNWVIVNRPRQPIQELDRFRVAWELADWSLYENHHLPGRTAVVQFSRGCPHACTYCGQHAFWRQWRHRSIASFVAELEQLRDRYDVRTVWIADENWGCVPELFTALLEALAVRDTGISLFCAMCAADVVRDASRISLYRRAGIICLMLGAESFDEGVLARIGKGNPYATTARAVQLLRQHGILSVVNVIYGLRRETWGSLWSTLVRLRRMSPDFFNALHLTPLSWTAEGRQVEPTRIVQLDQRQWDFRQPVVQPEHFSPKALALLVKLSEALFYMRPLRIGASLVAGDPVERAIVRDALPRLLRVYVAECLGVLRTQFAAPGQALNAPSQLSLLMPGKAVDAPTPVSPKGARFAPSLRNLWTPDVGSPP